MKGSTTLFKYLDCAVICDPNETHPNCNYGLDAIGDKFASVDPLQSVSQCFTCQYSQDSNGNVNGLETCGNKIEEESIVQS